MKATSYSEEFKKAAVKKYLSSDTSFPKLSLELGVSRSALHYWVKKYGITKVMKNSKQSNSEKWSAEKKLEAIIKTATMGEQELGEYLRTNGLHSDDLKRFKRSFIDSQASQGRPKLDPELVKLRKANNRLEKDAIRKDRALAEFSARVILLKKSHEIWGTEEDGE